MVRCDVDADAERRERKWDRLPCPGVACSSVQLQLRLTRVMSIASEVYAQAFLVFDQAQ